MVKMELPFGPVLVTGATGYVAGWVVKLLLDAGVTVHACVRSLANTAKFEHLQKMADQSPGSITFFAADLLKPGSHEEAMRGCRVVMHTASPFILASNITDPQRQVVEPALEGTRDVLETVNRVDSVECVVLTSSMAAVMDTIAGAGTTSTEADWNNSASPDRNAYAYSKVLAEREAWRIADAQQRWKLVVMNPAFVVGAGTAPEQTSATFDQFRAFADGAFSKQLPVMDTGVVDVRDVAEAHMRGAYVSGSGGRYILFGQILSLDEIAKILKEEFGRDDRWKFPPDTPWDPAKDHWLADNNKSIAELGLEYRPVRSAIIETFAQIAAA